MYQNSPNPTTPLEEGMNTVVMADAISTVNGLNADSILPALLRCNANMCSSGYEENDKRDWEKERAPEEVERLKCLVDYQILDTYEEPIFTRATTLGARIFEVPICLISFVDIGRQWFKSNFGLGSVKETSRSLSFCRYAIRSSEDVFEVCDALADPRFCDNDLVTGWPHIRYYAGCPLTTPEGYKLGSFCIIDTKSRPNGLNLAQKQTLMELTATVIEQMVERKRRRADLFDSKSKYMASTAHDLMTPLTGMQLSLALMKKSKDFAEIRDLANTSLHCAEMMGMIIHRAMALFRESGSKRSFGEMSESMTFDFDSVNTLILFNKVESVIRSYPKSVKTHIEIPKDCPKRILLRKGGETALYQSALNYLTNACKATKEGSIVMTVNVVDKMLQVECRDTGPGVKQESVSELFVPFSEVNKSTLNGSGLGLFSVASQVHRLGGKYGYKPNLNFEGSSEADPKGSVFWFHIPIFNKDNNDAEAAIFSTLSGTEPSVSMGSVTSYESDLNTFSKSSSVQSSKCSTPTTLTKKMRMEMSSPPSRVKCALVIDDSVTVRKPLAKTLVSQGLQCDVAENGLEGLEKMKLKLYDVVFLDFLMPVMDGIDCIKQLRIWESLERPDFPQCVIGISANANLNEQELVEGEKFPFERYGFNYFISKPITNKMVLSACARDVIKSMGAKLDKAWAQDGQKNSPFGPQMGKTTSMPSNSNLSSMGSFEDDPIPPPPPKGDSVLSCLIAEDSSSVRKMLKKTAMDAGYDLVVVVSTENCLFRELCSRSFDIVLVDEALKLNKNDAMGGSGTRAVRRFRQWEMSSMQRIKSDSEYQRNIWCTSAHFQNSVDEGIPLYDGNLNKPISYASLQELFLKVRRKTNNRMLLDGGEGVGETIKGK